MNRKFVEKMIAAKKMELEAFIALLPEPVQKHGTVIRREFQQMVWEAVGGGLRSVFFEAAEKESSQRTAGGEKQPETGKDSRSVRKVTIE